MVADSMNIHVGDKPVKIVKWNAISVHMQQSVRIWHVKSIGSNWALVTSSTYEIEIIFVSKGKHAHLPWHKIHLLLLLPKEMHFEVALIRNSETYLKESFLIVQIFE